MNWDALGAIAETLGALGVIATLVYLATQIRHNTNELKGAAIREINNIEYELCKEVRDDPELYENAIRGMLAWDSQPPRDQARTHMYFYSYTRWFETCWTFWRRGALDEAALKSRENFMFAILSNPAGGRGWWDQWLSLIHI